MKKKNRNLKILGKIEVNVDFKQYFSIRNILKEKSFKRYDPQEQLSIKILIKYGNIVNISRNQMQAKKKKGISFGGGAITLDKIIKNDNTKCRQKHREMGALLWEI